MLQTFFPAPRTVSRRIWRGISALLAVAVIGCGGGGDSSTGPRNADPTGLYSLRQVGNATIPTQIYRGPLPGVPDMTVAITGGELILQDDDRFSLALDLKLSANGQSVPRTIRFEGDYEIEGGTLTLMDDRGGGVDATLRNGMVAVELDMVGNGALKQYTFRYVP
jgi:hypothetical protein